MLSQTSSPLRTVRSLLRDPAGKRRPVAVVARYAAMRAMKFAGISAWITPPGSLFQFHYQPGCTVTERCYILGTYDTDGMALLAACCSADDLFFDVGANVGPWSLYAASLGARVVAFDGSAAAVTRLAANFARNRLDNCVARHLAVSSHDGSVRFSDADSSALNGVIEGGRTVPSRTLSTLAAEYGVPQLLKIDTEGHEPQVFAGLGSLLETGSIKCIVFEANGRYRNEELGAIGMQLRQAGYVFGRYDHGKRLFYAQDALRQPSASGDYHAVSASARAYLESKGCGFQFAAETQAAKEDTLVSSPRKPVSATRSGDSVYRIPDK